MLESTKLTTYAARFIFHGLPGNGKTIFIKALMRSLDSRPTPIPTLYVKSLGKRCDQDDIRDIFDRAQKVSPCLLVFEDIDSLVSDNVKSFFLNEVDGLEGNDGIMMIGSTNTVFPQSLWNEKVTHAGFLAVDRSDAGISKRPGRFDRKYHFALPSLPERARYCEFWRSVSSRPKGVFTLITSPRSKILKRTSLSLDEKFSSAVAEITEGFSFAYLQVAFVSALLCIVQAEKSQVNVPTETNGSSDDLVSNSIWKAMQSQVAILRKEMRDSRKSVEDAEKNSVMTDARSETGTSTGFGLGR